MKDKINDLRIIGNAILADEKTRIEFNSILNDCEMSLKEVEELIHLGKSILNQ